MEFVFIAIVFVAVMFLISTLDASKNTGRKRRK